MSRIAFNGNALGTGTVTIASPNTNSDRTVTLPDATGTINISGATNEVPAGSASAPALTTTGDTNTGMFFPAADTVAFSTAGVEAMRIDSSGNITVKDKIQFSTDAQTHIQAGGTSDVDLIVAADTNLRFETSTNEQARITSAGLFQFNSGYGSVTTVYGCRVWVNFNGTGTVAIRSSGNVSSITDNGTGLYTVNFTNALVDANYATTIGVGERTNDQRVACPLNETTTSVQIGTRYQLNLGSRDDSSDVSVSIFR